MFYTVYKITNQIDGKIYIGSHKTTNLNDDYMGSGKYLRHAQSKYGIENFVKEILFVFETAEQMYAKEAEIVNEEFLATENTYNIKIGGFGGWDHINSQLDIRIEKNRKASETTNSKHREKLSEWGKRGGKATIAKHGVPKKFIEAGRTSFLNKTHTEETKRKIGLENSKHQSGSGNSQYGTMWITDGTDNRKIGKTESIPEGWKKGRTMVSMV